MVIDEAYIPTMGMQILQGRNFSTDFKADSASSMIINEEMARMLEWTEPVGKTIRLQTGLDQFAAYQVVGLVRDFHFATIRHKVEPMFMLYNKNNSQLAVKLNTATSLRRLTLLNRSGSGLIRKRPMNTAS